MRGVTFAILLLSIPAMGCGSSEDSWAKNRQKTVPASGTVTYKGAPLADATVILAPVNPTGIGCAAKTDAEGKFELSTYPETTGAIPGSYNVMITKIEVPPLPGGEDGEGGPPPPSGPVYAKKLIPEKYGNPVKSGLKVDITDSGKTDIAFDLKD